MITCYNKIYDERWCKFNFKSSNLRIRTPTVKYYIICKHFSGLLNKFIEKWTYLRSKLLPVLQDVFNLHCNRTILLFIVIFTFHYRWTRCNILLRRNNSRFYTPFAKKIQLYSVYILINYNALVAFVPDVITAICCKVYIKYTHQYIHPLLKMNCLHVFISCLCLSLPIHSESELKFT